MTTLLAHEWLARAGGSENVFEQLTLAFPKARRTCLWNEDPERFADVEESWLARSPLRRSKALALPFLPSVWQNVDLKNVDLVVASSHAFAHQLATRSALQGIPSVAYVHTPARYIWAPEYDERGASRLARAGRNRFQRLDSGRTSSQVSYAANSQFIRGRIQDAWGQDAAVIYPPVNVNEIQSVTDWRDQVALPNEQAFLAEIPDAFVLGASRLVEYKRLDIAISAGESLGLPVVIAGSGPDEARLRDLATKASVPVLFAGRVSTEALYALYQLANLYVFMAIEDFGIMPVEAMAAGTPVLVNEDGGARESVESLGGGAVSDARSNSQLRLAAEMAMQVDIGEAQARSVKFSSGSFRAAIHRWVDSARSLTP